MTTETGARLGAPWPLTAARCPDGTITVGGVRVDEALTRFGSPVYLIDHRDLLERATRWVETLDPIRVFYASKAFPNATVIRDLANLGCHIDVSSEGELLAAIVAGVPGVSIELHGNVKSHAFLRRAAAHDVATVILDGWDDFTATRDVARSHGWRPGLGIRVDTGVAVDTHASVRTSGSAQKFGTHHQDPTFARLVQAIGNDPDLELVCLHTHAGSAVADAATLRSAAEVMVELAGHVRERAPGLRVINLGGGFPVPQRPGDPPETDPHTLRDLLLSALAGAEGDWDLTVEPGRAMVATPGVAVYRVAGVKRRPSGQVFVAVEGGMSDNPRPALYQSRYHAELGGPGSASARPTETVTVVGHHCESGDVLIESVDLPAGVARGDIVVIPACGAYQSAMAGNYNLQPRPAVVAVREGTATVWMSRESLGEVLGRDVLSAHNWALVTATDEMTRHPHSASSDGAQLR